MGFGALRWCVLPTRKLFETPYIIAEDDEKKWGWAMICSGAVSAAASVRRRARHHHASVFRLGVCGAIMAAMLAGCSTTQTRTITVPCRVTMPARPIMPTEDLPVDATLDAFVQAAAAEIERREGYEQELRAAIGACQ